MEESIFLVEPEETKEPWEGPLQTKVLPIIPLRGMNVLPGEIVHCDIGRSKTLQAMQKALENNALAFLCMQGDAKRTDITQNDLEKYGTICRIRQVFRIQSESVHLLVTGISRGHINVFTRIEPYFEAEIQELFEREPDPATQEALRRRLSEGFLEMASEKDRLTQDQRNTVLNTEKFSEFVDAVARQCITKQQDRQKVLETCDAEDRAVLVLDYIQDEMEIIKADRRIASKIKESMDKNQRDFVLREKLKAVKSELGDGEESDADLYRKQMEEKNLPEAVREKLEKEIGKLEAMPSGSHEIPMQQSYIECVLDLPWTETTEDNLDLEHAREILDRDHYGMDKVKDRIIEMLAVQKLTGNPQGQILCLVGPPGVGKTSIAHAIAEAMGRKFVRMSLGGVHDEAEIRGHRRTYIGAMPGRIINAMRQAKTVNPLLLFDEIDKLGKDIHGDPASAMLEVLDSAQNNTFADHYLEIPYDLSKCLLVTTANDPGTIPKPLYDRMEVIEVPSYLFNEKIEIARRHLLPKQMERNGISAEQLTVSDAMLALLIDGYTKEAGVREIERVLGSVCRKAACNVVNGQDCTVLDEDTVVSWLGPRKYYRDPAPEEGEVGLVTGLAWTSVGGETLEIEATAVPGKGTLQLTGQLGDVMQESVKAALTYVRANAERLLINPEIFEKTDLHVHVPEGAVPKDGPSAGIAMMTALTSVLTGIPVKASVAMTGEITLRGRVLPIGGLREKLLAAVRAGISTVILPVKNKDDLFDVPESVRSALDIRFVENADEVLREALSRQPELFVPSQAASIVSGESHAAICH